MDTNIMNMNTNNNTSNTNTNTNTNTKVDTSLQYSPYYVFHLYVDEDYPELNAYYKQRERSHNEMCKNVVYHQSPSPSQSHSSSHTFDAGFDLALADQVSFPPQQTRPIHHKVRGFMTFHTITGTQSYCGYYLYPRSSTGSKTPLRLSNSVGIIDSGYRGELIAYFDNRQNDTYVVDKFQRVVQICPPDLTYPMFIHILSGKEEFEKFSNTQRGHGGFGSTDTKRE
jgi:dUTPase